MANSTQEEEKLQVDEADGKSGRRLPLLNFTHPFLHKANSSSTAYTIYSRRDSSPASSEVVENNDTRVRKARGLRRTRSEAIVPRVREQWGNDLWTHGALKESLVLLRTSVAEYEKEASRQQWEDLLKINADVADLGHLLAEARKKNPKKGDGAEDMDTLSKFNLVAVEYTKLFDAVMNQSPEYAGLAWAVIRMLLVAHTNHKQMKQAVQKYIIQFGHEFGVVNNLMMSHPTEKMVEAVCEAYATFSKFLAKAVKYYKESRMKTALKSFTYPWETTFKDLVQKIEDAFKRIKEIANAGHLGMTVHTNEMLETIGCGQEQMRDEIYQNNAELRQHLKLEMKNEMHHLFQTFDRDWISRFEQIMSYAIRGHPDKDRTENLGVISIPPKSPAAERGDSNGASASKQPISTSFLSEYVGRPKRLKRFRDKSFPILQKLSNDRVETNIRLRHTSSQDLQQIVTLLRSEQMRLWLLATSSSLIWVNTVKLKGLSDWATTFSIRIVEHAAEVENMAVLYHLCGNHSPSSTVSTPAVMLQSLIMQLIEQRHGSFSRQAEPFTLEHFQDARDDVFDLWELFMKLCAEAQVAGVWLVLDHIDNLRRGEDYDFILQALLDVMKDETRTFKILCSARFLGTPDQIAEAAASVPSIYAMTVPKATRPNAASQMLRQKRIARLPDDHGAEKVVAEAPKPDIDALLQSSSEEDKSSDGEDGIGSPLQSISVKRQSGEVDLESDASMEFMLEDPFASTEDDEEDDVPLCPGEEDREEGVDSDNDFAFMKRSAPRRSLRSTDPRSDPYESELSSDNASPNFVASSTRREWQLQRTARLRGRRGRLTRRGSAERTKEAADSSTSDFTSR